jgi:hypothetical protein
MYFNQLINIRDFPDFVADARRLAVHYLTEGAQASVKGTAYEPLEDFLEYSEREFDVRMKLIYDTYLQTMYDPHWFETGILEFKDEAGAPKKYDIGRVSDAIPRERIFQMAPFNLIDGGWLQDIQSVGPTTKIHANLFSIWNDEVGNGVPEHNHANVYDALLRSINLYLPPITSREFVEQDFLPGAFTQSVFELAVGNFPQEFFPELLGMTLYLEWEATPTLTAPERMLARRGMNPIFYRLHVAIDNVSEGHGSLAKEAVKLYLEDQREEGGEKAVQEAWLRIRNGYITWATAGSLGQELVERYLVLERKQINISADSTKKKCWPDFKRFYRRQMIRLVQRKAPFARQVHKGRSVGGRALSSLFDDPEALLDALERDGFIDLIRPRDSKLLALMDFSGPMYKVFTDQDKTIVLDWIESIRMEDRPCIDSLPVDAAPASLPDQMAALITKKAALAMTAHDGISVTGVDGKSVALTSLFESPASLMQVLVHNGWIVPADPDRSMFYSRIVSNGGPMDGVFDEAEKTTIGAWISAGALPPGAGAPAGLMAANGEATTRLAAAALPPTQAGPTISRQLIGMGAVH